MLKLTKIRRVWISGILVAISFILKNLLGHHIITDITMIASTIVAGTPILKNAISAIRYKILGIDALVSIAVIGAVLIGEYWEAAAVTFLFMFGDFLESKTMLFNKYFFI